MYFIMSAKYVSALSRHYNTTLKQYEENSQNYANTIRIPSDLSTVIPSAELVKSLKTTQKATAKAALLTYLKGALKVFSLYRSGFLSTEQARSAIDTLLSRRQKVTPVTPVSVTPKATPFELLLQVKSAISSC